MAEEDLFGLVSTDQVEAPRPPKPIVSLNDLPDEDANPFGESSGLKDIRAGAAVVGNQDADSTKFRKSVQLGKENKVDPELIDVDQEAWAKDFRTSENLRIAQSNQAIRDFLIDNPINARAAQDDLPVLDKITTYIKDAWQISRDLNIFTNPSNIFKGGDKLAPEEPGAKPTRVLGWSDAFMEGQENFHLGILKGQYQKTPIDQRGPLKAKIDEVQAAIAARPEARDSYIKGLLGGFLGQMYESLPYVAPHTIAGTAVGSAVGASVGSAVPGPGTAAGTVSGFTLGAATGTIHGFAVVAAQQSAGSIFYAVDNIAGLDESQKQLLAATGGLAVGMMEVWGGHIVHSGVQKLITNIATSGAGQVALKQFTADLASAQIQGGIVNAGQFLAEQLAENIGKYKGDKSLASIFNDPAAQDKLIKDVSQQFIDGLVLATFVGGATGLPTLKRGTREGDARLAAHTLGNQKKLDDLVVMSEESKLKAEAPNVFAAALSHQAPDPLLHIDPAFVREYKNKFDFIPDINKQLADSEALGTEIKVKQSDLIAHLDPEVYKAGSDLIRQASDVMSPIEAKKMQLKEEARQELEAAKAAEEKALAEGKEIPPTPPKEQMSDADLLAGIFGKKLPPEATATMPSEIKLPEILVGPEPTTLPPAVVSRGQALIDRFFGKGRAVPTEDQMAAYIQAENLRNFKITPLQQASVSPTPEALSTPSQGFTEQTGTRPQTPGAEVIPPASNADKTVNLDVEIGPVSTKSLIEQFREVMEAAPPGDLGEAALARALSRKPGNINEFNRFIDEEARLLGITDIKEVKERAEAALAALGTRLIKEETAAVVNGLTDADAKKAAQATAQAIDYQRHIMAMAPLFEAGEGMDTATRAVHEQHIQDVQAQLSESVFQAAREITEKKETKRWNDAKQAMRPEVEQAIAETPVIMADDYFRTGKSRALGDEVQNVQMTKADVDAMFTREELDMMEIKSKKLSDNVLLKGNKWAKEDAPNAASPDAMAPMFGYATGIDMMLDLLQYRDGLRRGIKDTHKETHGERFDRLVEEELNRRMISQYGDLGKIIEKNSVEAALSIAQERVFIDELNALSGLTGADLINIPEIRTLVDERMRDMSNAQATNVKEYQHLAGKHGRLAKEAKDAGDNATALMEKKQQLQASMMATWGTEHRKKVTLGSQLTARLTKTERIKDFDPEINTRMLQLVAMSGLDPGARTTQVLQKDIMALDEPNLPAWIKQRNDESHADTIPTPTYLSGPVIPLRDIRDMQVKNFNEYYDTLRALEYAGKRDKQVGLKNQELHMDEVMKVLNAQIEDLRDGRGYEKFGDPVQPERIPFLSTWRGYVGNALRAETVTMKMDRLQDDGILNRVLITPLKDAQKLKGEVQLDVGKFLQQVDHGEWAGPPGAKRNTLSKQVPNDTIIAPNGKPREFRTDEMLVVALNWGNATNRHLMANTLKTEQTLINDWLMRNMTKENWDFVQNLWKMQEEKMNPLRDGVYRRTRGFGMEYPDPISFVDAHGVSRAGGYWPIMKQRTGMPEGKMADSALIDTRVYDAMPANSHRQFSNSAKNGEDIQLSLNFDEIPHRIKEEIHELTHREAVQNAAKIINDKRFYEAVFDTFGKAQADIFKPWLASISNDGGKADLQQAITMRWLFNKVQSNAITNVIGFNPGTVLVHSPTALMNTIGETGLYTFKAIRDTIGDSKLQGLYDTMFKSKENFDEMVGFAIKNSAELGTRISNKNRDIAYSLGQWGKYENFQHNAEWWGQSMISYTDYASAAMAWWGGYRKAIDDGFSQEEAFRLGDRTVRLAHNSSNLMDKSAFSTDRALRPFAQFYGFFNHVYNQMHLRGFEVAEGTRKGLSAEGFWDTGKAFGGAAWTASSALIFYWGALALIHQMVRGEPKNDDHWGKTFMKEMAGVATGTLPFIKETSYALLHGEYAKASIPLTAAMDVPRRWMRDVKKWSSKVQLDKPSTYLPPAQTSFELAGVFGGVKATTKQMGRWMESIQRMERGEEKPPSTFTDWRRLFVYGRQKPIGTKGKTPVKSY